MLIAPLGSSAALLAANPDAPFAQPRNIIGGHAVCATVGVAVATLDAVVLHQGLWLAGPLAVSGSVVAMLATNTMHPPGGGTALLAVLPSATAVHALGWLFPVAPAATSALVLTLSGCAAVRLAGGRYPKSWW